MMKSILKKSFDIMSIFFLMMSSLITVFNLDVRPISAATATTAPNPLPSAGPLVPGTTTYDTGDHSWSAAQWANANDFVGVSTSSTASFDGANAPGNIAKQNGSTPWTNGGWFDLVNSGAGNGAYAMLSGAVNMSQAFQISSTFRATGSSDWAAAGDSLGFFMTPNNVSTVTASASGATGKGLGIQGLSDSYFIGRDLYSNLGSGSTGDVDGTQGAWVTGPGSVLAIRSTDSTGNLMTSGVNYSNIQNSTNGAQATQNGSAYIDAADNTGTTLGISNGTRGSQMTEYWTMFWNPDSTNTAAAGFTSGTLMLRINKNGNTNYPTASNGDYWISTHVNMQNTMNIGYVGATGQQSGALSVNVPSNNGFNAAKGTKTLTVNYLNSATGAPITAMPSTQITGNTRDTFTVAAPGGTGSYTASSAGTNGTYTYVAPKAPTGYSFCKVTYGTAGTTAETSTAPFTLVNFDATTVSTNPNQINVYYTPAANAGSVNYFYQSGTPGTATATDAFGDSGLASPSSNLTAAGFTAGTAANLPSNQSLSGMTDNALSVTLNTIPAGYHIDHIIAPDGKSYSTIAAATAANPNYTVSVANGGTNARANNFVVVLAANTQTAQITVVADTTGLASTIAVPSTTNAYSLGSGLTGAAISSSNLTSLSNQITSDLTGSAFANWSVGNIVAPNGNSVKSTGNLTADLTTAIAQNPNFSANSNNFVIHLTYAGSLTLTAPNTIDFGTHNITGQAGTGYKAQLDNNVTVTDSRANPQPWTISVAVTQALQQVQTDNSGNPLTDSSGNFLPVAGGLSFDGDLDFAGSFNNGKPVNPQVMTIGTQIPVYTQATATSGTVTVLNASSATAAGFYLQVPLQNQKPNVKFAGKFTWTISNVPGN